MKEKSFEDMAKMMKSGRNKTHKKWFKVKISASYVEISDIRKKNSSYLLSSHFIEKSSTGIPINNDCFLCLSNMEA